MINTRDLRPMLAVGGDPEPPLEGAGLLYEPKYDGIRAIVELVCGPSARARLWSRNGNEKTAQFPDIVAALEAWGRDLSGHPRPRWRGGGARRGGDAAGLPAPAASDPRQRARLSFEEGHSPARRAARRPRGVRPAHRQRARPARAAAHRSARGARARARGAPVSLLDASDQRAGGRRWPRACTRARRSRGGRGCWSSRRDPPIARDGAARSGGS